LRRPGGLKYRRQSQARIGANSCPEPAIVISDEQLGVQPRTAAKVDPGGR